MMLIVRLSLGRSARGVHGRSWSSADGLLEDLRDRPGALACVGDDRVRHLRCGMAYRPKRDAGVHALEDDGVARGVEPETHSVPLPAVRVGATRPDHLANPVRGHDPPGVERVPQGVDVGGRRRNATVTYAP